MNTVDVCQIFCRSSLQPACGEIVQAEIFVLSLELFKLLNKLLFAFLIFLEFREQREKFIQHNRLLTLETRLQQ